MLQVAFITTRPEFLGDRIFNYPTELDTSSSLRKWVLVRDELERRGSALHTYDWYRQHGIRPDALIVDDITGRSGKLLVSLLRAFRLSPRRVLVTVWEPPVVRRTGWKWMRWWAPLIGAVATYDRRLPEHGARFLHIPLPQPALLMNEDRNWDILRERPRTRFAAMIRSDKSSDAPGELYSTRRNLLRFYERVAPDSFDLFGFGWNNPSDPRSFSTQLYRGVASHQIDVFPDYRFAFSIDNSRASGLITYDIFSALQVGTVPVYLGAPDITDFVPADCFIDMSHFATLEELHSHLCDVAEGDEWQDYRAAGFRFLSSDAAESFSGPAFVRRMLRAIERVSRS